MKLKSIFVACLVAILFVGCGNKEASETAVTSEADTLKTESPAMENVQVADDRTQLQNLVRKVLNWASAKQSIGVFSALEDPKDSLYTGFDLRVHERNVEGLKKTGFFAKEFTDNYDKIIRTLDKNLRSGKYGQWLVGDLPSFRFANDVNPWCACQDVPFDNPNPYDYLEVDDLKIENGTATANWYWGNRPGSSALADREYPYRFRAVKENDVWKISYMQEFDFDDAVK